MNIYSGQIWERIYPIGNHTDKIIVSGMGQKNEFEIQNISILSMSGQQDFATVFWLQCYYRPIE